MIGLFERSDGTFPVTDIKNVRHVERGIGRAEHYVLSRHSGAASITLWPLEYADLLARPVQIMPAESGTRLIMVYSLPCDDAPSADSDPVIAWALCTDGQVRPVLPSGVRRSYQHDDQNVWHPDYVQMPDDRIYQFGLEADPGTYTNIDEIIAAETSRLKRHEAERQRLAEKGQAA